MSTMNKTITINDSISAKVEYEYVPEEKMTFNHPYISEELDILSVSAMINKKETDITDILNDYTLSVIETSILDEIHQPPEEY